MLRWLLVLASALTLIGAPAALAASLPIILQVQSQPLAWGDCRLTERLTLALSRNPDLHVIVPDTNSAKYPAYPRDRVNLDSLLNWGTELGGRYLLTVEVDREALERRKTFNVPVLFHRWENTAVISGELRLIDLLKGRLVLAEPFEEKLSAAQQFQSSCEDNPADPDLHINAVDKTHLFLTLETRLADRLVGRITRHMRGR